MDSSLTAEKFHARCIVTANIFFCFRVCWWPIIDLKIYIFSFDAFMAHHRKFVRDTCLSLCRHTY